MATAAAPNGNVMMEMGRDSSMKSFRVETLSSFGNVSDRPEAASDPDVSELASCFFLQARPRGNEKRAMVHYAAARTAFLCGLMSTLATRLRERSVLPCHLMMQLGPMASLEVEVKLHSTRRREVMPRRKVHAEWRISYAAFAHEQDSELRSRRSGCVCMGVVEEQSQ